MDRKLWTEAQAIAARHERGRVAEDAPPAVQRMVFGEDLVEGSVRGPDGEIIRLVPVVTHSSLIEIRRDFLPETVKSLEDF